MTAESYSWLQGDNVYLRPVEVEDADQYYATLYDEDVRYLTGTKASFSKHQVVRHLEAKGLDSSSVLLWIIRKDTNEPIGDIELQEIDGMNRSAGLRIAINGGSHQGKGFGSEAIRLMLDYAFGICNLHRVELNVYAYNERAIHVYQKIGFKQEGIQRDALFYNHRYYNSIIMSMLEDEYREKYVK
ncbi:GNAT family N-acetyltransferase [Paenibacillus sp. 1001270B_150601_E10]|uniref:GNAT family N-acetyltransferase n=1 Tax=Paenibacillus sp. 1001270B_150601_E10 TaxID=2787079 RepID=UPI00189F7B9D|nr:GNAT family protein [Paenibacillus sp. 1001270B_150601_E10]